MALPLVNLRRSDSNSGPCCEMFLDSYARFSLERNFTTSFTPVLFIAQMHPELENSLPAEFVNASREDCVLVWPQPVVVQGRNLLLMKMGDFDVLKDDEGMQRALSVFLSNSEHCIVNFDRSLVYRGLSFLQSVYGELQRAGLHKVHFYVRDQSKAMNRSQASREADFMSTAAAQFTHFVPSEEWLDSALLFRRILGSEQVPQFSNFQHWIRSLRLRARFCSVDLDRTSFVTNFLYFGETQLQQFEEILEQFEQKQSVLRQASVRKFLVRGDGQSCTLDDTLLSDLRANFDQRIPTVVLTVVGEPGSGKSTFLNHLIQRALQRHSPHPYFPIGNTQTHTTKESFILSCPLPLPNSENQMLLVDLEGLGGMETTSEKEAVIQYNLVSGVLAISSVPCIFVKNVAAHQKTVEGYIDRLVCLSKSFGFQCNRIHFLFHDKDFRPSEGSENIHMLKWIANLNRHYFGRRSVIRLMNKPQFTDPSKADMCRDFFNTLLADCDYPKLNISGSPLSVAEMLVQIQYITQHSSTDVGEIVADLTSIDETKKAKLQELEELSHSITSDGTLSLVSQFNERYRMYICSMKEAKHTGNQQRYLQLSLEEKAQELRHQLHLIESHFVEFRAWSDDQIEEQINNLLDSYYDDSIWVKAFLNNCSSLELKLQDIAIHYPPQEPRVKRAVARLSSKRSNLRNWYIGKYALQGTLTVATMGLGASAAGARGAVMAGRLGWTALTGLAATKGFTTFFGSKQPVSTKALTLFTMKDNAFKWEEQGLELFNTPHKKCIVLVIARQSMSVESVLNSLVHETTGLSSSDIAGFQTDESAQVVSFRYSSRQAECIMLLFTLRNTLADQAIELVAAAIAERVSVCCLCESEESKESNFGVDLFAAVGTRESKESEESGFYPDAVSSEVRQIRTKVCLTLKQSLSSDFKNNLKAAVLNAHFVPVLIQVETLNSQKMNFFKMRISQCMEKSHLLENSETQNVILRAKIAVQGFGLR